MKQYLLLIALSLSAFFAACNKSDSETTPNDTESSQYFVKYSGKVMTNHIIRLTYTYLNEKGFNSSYSSYSNTESNFATIIGPVKKGYNASVKCQYDQPIHITVRSQQVTIEVCKEGEPFTVRAVGSKNASYTIDF